MNRERMREKEREWKKERNKEKEVFIINGLFYITRIELISSFTPEIVSNKLPTMWSKYLKFMVNYLPRLAGWDLNPCYLYNRPWPLFYRCRFPEIKRDIKRNLKTWRVKRKRVNKREIERERRRKSGGEDTQKGGGNTKYNQYGKCCNNAFTNRLRST